MKPKLVAVGIGPIGSAQQIILANEAHLCPVIVSVAEKLHAEAPTPKKLTITASPLLPEIKTNREPKQQKPHQQNKWTKHHHNKSRWK